MEVLFGLVNPSGRLPISFPRSAGHIQTIYNHNPSQYHRKYVLGETEPLFEFGTVSTTRPSATTN